MKNIRISSCIAALILAAGLLFATSRRAAADFGPPQDPVTALLTAGPWKLTSKTASNVRVFNKDGTFTTVDNKDAGGRWSVTKDFVILIFPTGHKEAITLPLNPKGTDGMADDGSAMTCIQLNSAAAISAASTPAPVETPAPAAVAPAPVVPGSAPAPVFVMTPRIRAVTTALLLSRPWKFLGSWWFAIRVFHQDGTFTTTASSEAGTWQVTNSAVALTFPDGHIDSIALPLSLKVSNGVDKDGAPVAIFPGSAPEPASASTPIQSEMDSFFHPTPPPHVVTPQEKAAIGAMLTAAPWKITGSSWSAIRVFDKAGAFTSVDKANEYGTWMISNNKVLIVFASGHTDTLSLPLDPKGTDGADQHGVPAFAIQQSSTGAAPTPAPTAPANKPPAPGGTPQPPQGATPPPFGKAIPD